MTKGRVKYLKAELDKVQRGMYYWNELNPESIKDLLRVVNGNKDRLILILTTLLIEKNENCGIKPERRREKVREILEIL